MNAPSSKRRVLLAGHVMPALEAELKATYDCEVLSDQADPAAYIAARGNDYDVLVTSKYGADAALIDSLPKLKAIVHFGVGYDNVDVRAAARRGVTVSNTPDVLNDCVADLAMGLLIDTVRGISASDRFVRRGEWTKQQFPLTTRLSGRRLGIAGLGRIGRTIAKRASGFDMDIRYFARNPVQGVPYGHEPSLAELAKWCDFLVVIVAGGAPTRHLVSADVIKALGPDGYLINVSRGSVVDEAALVDALANNRIAGAGLDVFQDEPKVPAALMDLDNVVLLPHIASGTRETRKAMADLVAANLKSFFENGRLVTPVPAPAAA
ncbi:MAG TPA: 2-hydroxyacid dehydrogenase [Ramlibacter sp.]|nr:2-hydroxyacid dehydrogenase [Ramlibacter sp.]